MALFLAKTMSGKGGPADKEYKKAVTGELNLSLDAEQKAEEIGDNEKEIANNVVEPVEQIKHVETMEVFTISSEPKTEPEADLESTRDTNVHWSMVGVP